MKYIILLFLLTIHLHHATNTFTSSCVLTDDNAEDILGEFLNGTYGDKAEYDWVMKQRLGDIMEARRQLRLREEAWKIDWSEIELIKRLAGGAFGDVRCYSTFPLFFSRSN